MNTPEPVSTFEQYIRRLANASVRYHEHDADGEPCIDSDTVDNITKAHKAAVIEALEGLPTFTVRHDGEPKRVVSKEHIDAAITKLKSEIEE